MLIGLEPDVVITIGKYKSVINLSVNAITNY